MLALEAKEYLVSYRVVVKDSYLYNDYLKISKAMSGCSGVESQTIHLKNNGFDDLKQLVNENLWEFVTYLDRIGLHVKSYGKTTNLTNKNTTILELRTHCFKVDFNDTFATITAINTEGF
ncbi:MAG: hypothetical protein WCR69_07235 [Sulfuricurvum sp.]